MGFPLVSPKVQYFDSSGNSLSGGKLYTKVAGGASNKTTWSDALLTTPNANPVILNARGEASVFAAAGEVFWLSLTDSAGVTIWTIDNQTFPSEAFTYPVSPGETTASVTPTDLTYPPGDIRRYGALPDATTDASVAFSNAIAACVNTGVTIVIEGGDYRIDSQIAVLATSGACRLNFRQDRNSRIVSYVTGSVSGYDFAGFAIRFDGWIDSTWDGLSLNYANGTAGIVVQCRKSEASNCVFNAPRIVGGAVSADRFTRTRIGVRLVGCEASAVANTYATYFYRFIAPYFNINHKCIEYVVGDGTNAGTQQPNASVLIGPQFSRYVYACDFNDTDEHFVTGAWHHSSAGSVIGTASSVTQAAGTATVTLTTHGLSTDDIVLITGATPTDYNGITRITVTGTSTFTYLKADGVAIPTGTVSPATGTITVEWLTVGYAGQTTYSQIMANIEPGGEGASFFIEDGGAGANVFNLIANTNRPGVIEDTTESNIITDRKYYGASGTWTARVGTLAALAMTSASATFGIPTYGKAFIPDQNPVAVASATDITGDYDYAVWRMGGTTTINTISDPGDASPIIHLLFASSITVQDATTAAGNIRLAAAGDLSATANDVLTLIWSKTDTEWRELSRSVN